MKRRSFLKDTCFSAPVLVFGVSACKSNVQLGEIVLFDENVDDETDAPLVCPFIAVREDGEVIIFAHRTEMGQGAFQSMPLILAEELDVNPENITIKQAQGDPIFGNQNVWGSESVMTNWMPLRKMGASIRMLFREAASQKWRVDLVNCYTNNGQVINKLTGDSLSYGSLLSKAVQMDIPKDPILKKNDEFEYIGKNMLRKDVALKANGQAKYGMDMTLPGMVYATILHAPAFNQEIVSIDPSNALQCRGVLDILKCERRLWKQTLQSVAVIAENSWAAIKGANALKIEWSHNGRKISTEKIRSALQKFFRRDR